MLHVIGTFSYAARWGLWKSSPSFQQKALQLGQAQDSSHQKFAPCSYPLIGRNTLPAINLCSRLHMTTSGSMESASTEPPPRCDFNNVEVDALRNTNDVVFCSDVVVPLVLESPSPPQLKRSRVLTSSTDAASETATKLRINVDKQRKGFLSPHRLSGKDSNS